MTSSFITNSLVLITFCSLGRATVSYQQHQSTVMLQSSGIAIATVHSILVVIDIVGNCLVCAIIKKNQDLRYGKTKVTLSFWDANDVSNCKFISSWGAGMVQWWERWPLTNVAQVRFRSRGLRFPVFAYFTKTSILQIAIRICGKTR